MVMMSNHRCLDCLLNRLFRWRSKKTSKLHVTGLCEGNPPVAGGFPSQRASNMEMFPFDDIIMVFCTCFSYVISSYLSHVRNLPIFFRVTSLDYFIGLPQRQWSNPELMCIISHYKDVIMSAMAPQITSLMIVYSIVYWDADQRKHQSSASLAFVWGIHRWPVNSPHKGPVTRKMFPFGDVIMSYISFITVEDALMSLFAHV